MKCRWLSTDLPIDYDSRDRRIKSAQTGWTDLVNADNHQTSADYAYTSSYDGRQELSQYNQVNGDQALYRQSTYLPNQVAIRWYQQEQGR